MSGVSKIARSRMITLMIALYFYVAIENFINFIHHFMISFVGHSTIVPSTFEIYIELSLESRLTSRLILF